VETTYPNLAKALAKAQSEFPELTFDSRNPHFKNQYLSLKGLLAAIRPTLAANDLLIVQTVSNTGGPSPAPALTTRLIHVESNEYIEDTMLLSAVKTDPQAQGSAVTYARRYAVVTLLDLVADEDDDGEAASGGESSSTSSGSSGRSGRKKSSEGTGSTGPTW
jgi:hypothetical protein